MRYESGSTVLKHDEVGQFVECFDDHGVKQAMYIGNDDGTWERVWLDVDWGFTDREFPDLFGSIEELMEWFGFKTLFLARSGK